MTPKTLFTRIIDRDLPASIAYEDGDCIAIHDIQPQAPVHLLVIPKKPIPRLGEATADDQLLLGKLLLTCAKIAQDQKLTNGFRVVINHGSDGGESVPHLHLHVMGKRPMAWPPG